MKDKIMAFFRSVREKAKPFWEKVKYVFSNLGIYLPVIGRFVMRYRKIILAVPVVIGAIYMAVFTSSRLPDYVGIDLQATGEYARLVTRAVAVWGPLAVTAACLLLMFCSKRTLYPWLISLFSLVLPLLVLVTNIFPA